MRISLPYVQSRITAGSDAAVPVCFIYKLVHWIQGSKKKNQFSSQGQRCQKSTTERGEPILTALIYLLHFLHWKKELPPVGIGSKGHSILSIQPTSWFWLLLYMQLFLNYKMLLIYKILQLTFMPKVNMVMMILKTRAKASCHIAVYTPDPAGLSGISSTGLVILGSFM